jgi:hypothetical protein
LPLDGHFEQINYCCVVVLDLGVLILAMILNPRAKRKRLEAGLPANADDTIEIDDVRQVQISTTTSGALKDGDRCDTLDSAGTTNVKDSSA